MTECLAELERLRAQETKNPECVTTANATIADFYLRALTSYHYQQPITRADLGAITDAADRLGIHLPNWTP